MSRSIYAILKIFEYSKIRTPGLNY